MRTPEDTPPRPREARRERWTAHRAQRREEFVAAPPTRTPRSRWAARC